MKYAIIKRRQLGLEVFQVVLKTEEDVKTSVFLSENGAHNWLRKELSALSESKS